MTTVFDVGEVDVGISDSDDGFVHVGLRELEVTADGEDVVFIDVQFGVRK
jgi:hypothetical protein